jgi:cyclohexyl-isocyanide hydratase
LPLVGAIPDPRRIVVDRNRITGGGVTAGIDVALQIAAEVAGREVAQQIQLQLEYDPHPPFQAGHPDVAPPELVARSREMSAGRYAQRRVQLERLRAARR